MSNRRSTARAALFAGVSTLALTVGAAELRAADMAIPPRAVLKAPPPAAQPGVLTMWVEGGVFWTGGGNSRTEVPRTEFDPYDFLPGSGSSPLDLPPTAGDQQRVGWEAAFGADYRFAGSPWHISFDVRYGQAKARDVNSSRVFAKTTEPEFYSSIANRIKSRESHFVADFMIGRDFGLGLGMNQVKFGVRVADLEARMSAFGARRGSFSPATEANGGLLGDYTFVTASSTTQRSKFLGVGPRLAAEGAIPLGGPWGIDWAGGIAVLFGDRTLKRDFFGVSGETAPNGEPIFSNIFAGNVPDSTSSGSVFNADVNAALSYWFTPRAKLSAGFRFDGYWNALRTLDASGNIVNVNRFYYGPFLRLTGAF